jgi:N-acetylglutamate synthase
MAMSIEIVPPVSTRLSEVGRDDAALAWRVEEACLNAWPALRQAFLGGWVLRFSGGLTRRANSANPLGIERTDFDALIDGCEALYRHHRQPTIFRLPSLIGPEIDERLVARGYSSEGLSLVLYGAIDAMPAARDAAVRCSPRPTAAWLAAMAALQRQTKRQAALYRRIVAALVIPASFAELAGDDGIAALAFGAIHDGVICYESVVSNPRRRRRGYARRVIASLAAWAQEQGATGACLEVEAANAPALALYAALGFKELYHYHYRRQPPLIIPR